MKKLIISTSIFVFSCLAITFFLNNTLRSEGVASASEVTHIPQANVYIVREHKGKISVFENENTEPFRITDILVNDLPEGDQKLLKKGIEVTSFEDLSKVLEDYLG